MKSSNIKLMAILMVGMTSNFFASSQSDIKKSNTNEFNNLLSAMESILDEYDKCFHKKQEDCKKSSDNEECFYKEEKNCRKSSHNELMNNSVINNYLKKLQNAAINNTSEFTQMFSEILSELKTSSHIDHNSNPYINLHIDVNKAMQDIAKIEPLNYDTFFNYINGLLTPKEA